MFCDADDQFISTIALRVIMNEFKTECDAIICDFMEEHNKEFPCSLIQKILELIERESDILQRGRPDSSLEGLRQRLNNALACHH